MGINIFKRSCSSSPYAVPDSNPDPRNFRILTEETVNEGEWLILLVQYPNCTNYEGKKLMVYRGFKNSEELLAYNRGNLDPHFSKGKGSPIARFKPIESSYNLIRKMTK